MSQQNLRPNTTFESAACFKGYRFIAGVDEAGRGPLAGPVVACACILPENLSSIGIADSKQLSEKERLEVYKVLLSTPGVHYGVAVVDSILIDQINILQATFEAMIRAVAVLSVRPDYLLVDGNLLPKIDIPKESVIGGDALVLSIAAASIIAKVTRDALMIGYHARFPEYGFDRHKGYGTRAHLEAIEKWGPSPIHRMSFAPLKNRAD